MTLRAHKMILKILIKTITKMIIQQLIPLMEQTALIKILQL